jgi:hypothetical protein
VSPCLRSIFYVNQLFSHQQITSQINKVFEPLKNPLHGKFTKVSVLTDIFFYSAYLIVLMSWVKLCPPTDTYLVDLFLLREKSITNGFLMNYLAIHVIYCYLFIFKTTVEAFFYIFLNVYAQFFVGGRGLLCKL